MRICTHCFNPKPDIDFNRDSHQPDGLKKHCKECHNRRTRELQYFKKHPIPVDKTCPLYLPKQYLYKALRKYKGIEPLEIPVKLHNGMAPIPHGCIIKPFQGKNRVFLATIRGIIDVQWEFVCSPEVFLGFLHQHGYTVALDDISPEKLVEIGKVTLDESYRFIEAFKPTKYRETIKTVVNALAGESRGSIEETKVLSEIEERSDTED